MSAATSVLATAERPASLRHRGSLARMTGPWFRRRLVVLADHGVDDVGLFRRQTDYLRERMNPVAIDEVIAVQQGAGELPPRAVLVTFDDGDRTTYDHALPILRERGVPAVVFVVGGLIGTADPPWFHEARELVRRGAAASGITAGSPDEVVRVLKQVSNEERIRVMEQLRASIGERVTQAQLRPEELREMEMGGIAVGNHTHTHPCLDRCGDAGVAEELTRAHEALTEWLGHPPRAFAYPNGNGDPRAERVLEELGYGAAFLFDHRIGAFPAANRFRISRVRVNSTTSMTRFRNIVSGLHPFIHHALGRA
jgi:peptidoglycan/xylan/chitin deacetylase (PgdA/CDA1 family)